MGLFDSLGVNVNLSKILQGAGQAVVIIILFIVIGAILYAIYYSQHKKKFYNKSIVWFEEIHGEMAHVGTDKACEMMIPHTNIPVFYIKKKNLYLPRPTIRSGKNEYWFAIRNNQEIVNFSMKNLNKEMEQANLNFDHTDMRYAQTNLKELIKRNYRDKSQSWWREYKDVISLVLLIAVLTFSFIFLFSKIGTLISQVGALIEQADKLVQLAQTKASGSGVIIK